MPRPAKLSLDEQLKKANEKVATLEGQLKAAKAEVKKLEAEKEQEESAALLALIKSGNKSMEEIAQFIKS